MTDAEREQVIRECIAALPLTTGVSPQTRLIAPGVDASRRYLETLLPKPDPVEVLALAIWVSFRGEEKDFHPGRALVENYRDAARWLIESGKVEVKG